MDVFSFKIYGENDFLYAENGNNFFKSFAQNKKNSTFQM